MSTAWKEGFEEIKGLLAKMQESIDKQNTDFTSRLDQINQKIDEEIRDSIQNLKDSVDAEVLALNNRCDIVEKKIVGFEELEKKRK